MAKKFMVRIGKKAFISEDELFQFIWDLTVAGKIKWTQVKCSPEDHNYCYCGNMEQWRFLFTTKIQSESHVLFTTKDEYLLVIFFDSKKKYRLEYVYFGGLGDCEGFGYSNLKELLALIRFILKNHSDRYEGHVYGDLGKLSHFGGSPKDLILPWECIRGDQNNVLDLNEYCLKIADLEIYLSRNVGTNGDEKYKYTLDLRRNGVNEALITKIDTLEEDNKSRFSSGTLLEFYESVAKFCSRKKLKS